MERIPSHTKIKGDLLLQLRDVKEDINKELSYLEKIKNQRREAEIGFAERERKLKDKESSIKLIEEKFGKIVDDKDSFILEKDKEITVKRMGIKTLEKDKEKLEKEMFDKKVELNKKLSKIEIRTREKEQFEEGIIKNIDRLNKELYELHNSNKELFDKNASIKNENERLTSEMAKRESVLSEREKAMAIAKSELRVWSVRFHNKYDKFMSAVEKELIPEIE